VSGLADHDRRRILVTGATTSGAAGCQAFEADEKIDVIVGLGATDPAWRSIDDSSSLRPRLLDAQPHRVAIGATRIVHTGLMVLLAGLVQLASKHQRHRTLNLLIAAGHPLDGKER